MVEIGQSAPSFSVLGKDRQQFTQESFPGKHLVLAFYPLAFTGG